MTSLLQFNLPVLAAAFLIGVATAWWMLRGTRRPPDQPDERSSAS